MGAFPHRSLRVYQLALGVGTELYRVTRSCPPAAWSIARQLTRAASSIALNIAEGAGEYAPGEKARFYRFARRSAAEASAALDYLCAIHVIAPDRVEPLQAELGTIAATLTSMAKNQESRSIRSSMQPRNPSRRRAASEHPPH